MNEAVADVSELLLLINPQGNAWRYYGDLLLAQPLEVIDAGGEVRDAWFKAVCSCGQVTRVLFSDVKAGRVKNCGDCYRIVCAKHTPDHLRRRRRPAGREYASMVRRCRESPSPLYKRCGRNGIGFASRWSCYYCFEQDLGVPLRGAGLVRRDPNGDFTPENCFWSAPPCCA